MTVVQRIKNIITGVGMIAGGILMTLYPDMGIGAAALILSISLTLYGFRQIIYYITLARKMVGGRRILYRGVIILDLGLFTLTVSDNTKVYVAFYLLGIHFFYGIIDILRSREARRINAPSWKLSLITGLGNIMITVIAFIFAADLRTLNILVYLYAAGVIYSGFLRILSSLRRTAIIYIQ